VIAAVGIATSDCGGDCFDEGAGIGVVLVGLPAAGGLAGRAMAKGKRVLIYSTR
jgi:hypothetical protein